MMFALFLGECGTKFLVAPHRVGAYVNMTATTAIREKRGDD